MTAAYQSLLVQECLIQNDIHICSPDQRCGIYMFSRMEAHSKKCRLQLVEGMKEIVMLNVKGPHRESPQKCFQ
jgi:hypothetical protein